MNMQPEHVSPLSKDTTTDMQRDVLRDEKTFRSNPFNYKVARPYARAAFSMAERSGHFSEWHGFLDFFSCVIRHPEFNRWWHDPRVSNDELLRVMVSLGQEWINPERENFLKLLMENKRLDALPEMLELFETYQNEAEKIVDAFVWTYAPFSEQQVLDLKTMLERRYKRSVKIEFNIEPRLMGGAVIRVGDDVIDGSVRTQLERLSQFIGA